MSSSVGPVVLNAWGAKKNNPTPIRDIIESERNAPAAATNTNAPAAAMNTNAQTLTKEQERLEGVRLAAKKKETEAARIAAEKLLKAKDLDSALAKIKANAAQLEEARLEKARLEEAIRLQLEEDLALANQLQLAETNQLDQQKPSTPTVKVASKKGDAKKLAKKVAAEKLAAEKLVAEKLLADELARKRDAEIETKRAKEKAEKEIKRVAQLKKEEEIENYRKAESERLGAIAKAKQAKRQAFQDKKKGNSSSYTIPTHDVSAISTPNSLEELVATKLKDLQKAKDILLREEKNNAKANQILEKALTNSKNPEELKKILVEAKKTVESGKSICINDLAAKIHGNLEQISRAVKSTSCFDSSSGPKSNTSSVSKPDD